VPFHVTGATLVALNVAAGGLDENAASGSNRRAATAAELVSHFAQARGASLLLANNMFVVTLRRSLKEAWLADDKCRPVEMPGRCE
jgi:hypothetical protein